MPGELLSVHRAPSGEITLSWGNSCMASDIDYHVYEGVLGDFYSHTLLACTTAGATSLMLTPGVESSYYLVAATDGFEEGSYGSAGDGSERPPATTACLPQSTGSGCP